VPTARDFETSPDDSGPDGEAAHSATPMAILASILRSDWIDGDGFRLSLWSGFYTAPVFAKIERKFGLLRDANNVLFCLAAHGPLTAKSISDVLGRPKNSISRAVDHLLQRGLIRREPVASDRRHALLSIERSGLAMIKKTTAMFRAREAEMLRALSPVERVALDGILTKLMDDAGNWLSAD
jgi:MarR family transcriptional regulator, temperature-dependent positive regulator of motility